MWALALAGPIAAQSEPSPAELARSVQKKYESIADFSTDFVHTYRGGVLRREAVERGRLLVKKPGKMRWTYESPEKKLFVSDGVKIYSYVPADRQVIVDSVPPDTQATTPALFLTGNGNLIRDFSPSLTTVSGAPPDTYALKLTPAQKERDYDSLVLVVDRPTLRLRMLVTTDAQGGQSTFTFSNMKDNVGIPDKEFTFTIPRGVDVITNGPSNK